MSQDNLTIECKKAISYFPGVYNYIVYLRTYSKFLHDKGRRELWPETVDRFMSFFRETISDKLSDEEYIEIHNSILNMEVMPSMRILQFAGEAIKRNNICAYNCSYVAPTNLEVFRDVLMILMSGSGVGFSVEEKYVSQLPIIEVQKGVTPIKYTIEDSREGWCYAFHTGIILWYSGYDVIFDYSHIRPSGSILKTSGGRASGPEPLKNLLDFARRTILSRQGNRLSTVEVHDLMCKIGIVVLCGGVRRCLAIGSRVNTPEGYINIERIRIGDKVISGHEVKEVRNVFYQGIQNLMLIKHQYGELRCTPNHRILFNDLWTYAKYSYIGGHLSYLHYNGNIIYSEITNIFFVEPDHTYDIEVDDNHYFFCENVLVHNSSEISLSDLNDESMRNAKKGAFWVNHPDRIMANNSAVYNVRPTDEELEREWKALIESGSGERGIMNRSHLKEQLPRRRIEVIGDRVNDIGTNPCGEIYLLPNEFCNLSTIAVRPNDDETSLSRKIRLASIIGTFQSTLTYFPVISDNWKDNCIMERLLGVSMTGMRDCKYIDDHPEVLNKLKEVAINTNIEYASRFGITPSTAVTACKPEGTTSEMLGTSSGIHARFAPYYIRRIRISATDPLAMLLIDHGIPHHPENGQSRDNVNTWVFEFPQKSPEGSKMLSELSALDQLNYWKEVKTRYTEHNPSVTIHVKNHEWDQVLQWLKDNWSIVGGLSFLPYNDHIYELAPFEAISKEEYDKRLSSFPEIDFSKLTNYEKTDTTQRKAQWACVGDKCSLE